MATSHMGEFHDDETYTHKRVAARLGVADEWVKTNMLFPRDRSGERTPGVPFKKVGVFYFITGEKIRLWLEGLDNPDEG